MLFGESPRRPREGTEVGGTARLAADAWGSSRPLLGTERPGSNRERSSAGKGTGEARSRREVARIGRREAAESPPMRRPGGGAPVVVRGREGRPHGEGAQDGSCWMTERFATSRGLLMNVEEIQRRLWERSREHKCSRETVGTLFAENPWRRRARNLYDLLHHPQWLRAACDRVLVRSRGKAPGVDGETASRFAIAMVGKLEALRLELKRGTYRPQPVRRVMIPKANGKMRALGIPCLRDKIVQEAMRMALEPIYEVEFHDSSYGFRPHRSTHHAVFRCQRLMHRGFAWVIEGDVKACFDEISHRSILRNLREKVCDNKFLNLVGLFLKAGVEVEGVVQPTTKGVPQGGVLSPLLANVVLNRLDWFLHGKGKYDNAMKYANANGRPNLRFVRYADDWCVFITRADQQYAAGLRDEIRDFLARDCGLELSAEKTRITHVRDGFDFLGFRMELGTGRGGMPVPKIKVGPRAVTRARRRLDEAMRYRPHQESVACRLLRGSMVVRGWAEYYRIAHDFYKAAGGLDHYAFWSAVKAICRKLNISTAKCMRRYKVGNTLGLHHTCRLAKFSATELVLYGQRPQAYEPGQAAVYEDDLELEAGVPHQERKRYGTADVKWAALAHDGFRCRQCGASVTPGRSHADHIKPVQCFASFREAHVLDNVQTLCLDCHRAKTRRERKA